MPAKAPASRNRATRNLLLGNQLCFALYSASLTMTKRYRPLLAELGLTYPQYVVMLALWERDDLSVSELGERVALDSGTLTPLLKRLESLKLLRRTRSELDERRVHVTLTEIGSALHARAGSVNERVACTTGCTADERAALTRSLQKLRASLQEHL